MQEEVVTRAKVLGNRGGEVLRCRLWLNVGGFQPVSTALYASISWFLANGKLQKWCWRQGQSAETLLCPREKTRTLALEPRCFKWYVGL